MIKVTIVKKNGVTLKAPVIQSALNMPEARRLATQNDWDGTMSDGRTTLPLRQQ